MKKATTLNRYLSLKFALVAILPILISGAFALQFLVPQSKRQTAIQHEGMARAVAGQILAHLSGGERKLLSLSAFLEPQTTWHTSRITPLLDAQCGTGDLFETIYIASTREHNIRFVGLAEKETRISRLKRNDLLGIDLSGRDFMFTTDKTKTPAWSETFLSTASSRLAVALTVPVQNDVIIGEITLDRLSELISHLSVEEDMVILVLDRYGRIIADSQRVRWGRQLDLKALLPEKSDTRRSVFSILFELDGKRMLGTIAKVHLIEWNVLIAQPVKTAYKSLIAAFITLASGLGFALILALAVAWFQVGEISTVFKHYTKMAKRVAQGKYDLKIPQSNIFELRNLGQHLQRMAVLIDQREKQLRLTQAAFDNASIGIFQIDDDGRILNANQCACDTLEYTIEELRNLTLVDIDPNISQEQFKENRGQLKENPVKVFERTHRRKDDSLFPVEIVINYHEFEGEKIYIFFQKDITAIKEAEIEKKKTEKKLLQAQKLEAIGTLAGGIAHDFNNILASIIGFTQICMKDLSEDHQANQSLQRVFQAGLRARDLVAQILTFSRQSDEKFQKTNITFIVKEVIKLLRASIPASIEIKLENPSKCGSVYADPVQVHQILMNLCTNAYHAIGNQHGLIRISLDETDIGPNDFPTMSDIKVGKHLKLGVSDTGHGMDNVTLGKIFDPYFTTKKKGEGTGLGLAVVHGIVKKHKGHITAYSEPGQGTSFYIYLPCIDGEASTDHEAIKQEVPTGSEHILIVDDEEFITEMLEGMLGHIGYRMTAFHDAEAAIAFFKSEPNSCDLLITDMTMPTMSGLDLSRRIRKIDSHIPIIILTGFSEQLNPEALQSIGVGAVLKKPVLELELAQCIRKVIDE